MNLATPGNPVIPPEPVLSTLNTDGTRRWLEPRLSRGRFLAARRAVAWLLIAIFALVPHLRTGGKPVILLDLAQRQFTILGKTFLPTDTLLLALLMLTIFVTIFLFTALFGRVWCGWGCPQTVYLEFLYRPLERLFRGTRGRGGRAERPTAAWRMAALSASYVLVSMFLAHTFLAYFVGVEALEQWMRRSPLQHPASFAVMAATTGLMLVNFAWFREQTCVLACPYGRFQSALLDRNSLIISYDTARGEPRGKLRRGAAESGVSLPVARSGDCVDCNLCVTTCPTGIDIRRGLQMECIGCAQCIDACDAVMERIKRPAGLIRYTSQARLGGERGRIVRGRVVIYGLILAVASTALTTLLLTRSALQLTVLRGPGLPFVELPDGTIANAIRARITNRSDRPQQYALSVGGPAGVTLRTESESLTLKPGESEVLGGILAAPRDLLQSGQLECELIAKDERGNCARSMYRVLGPTGTKPRARHEESHEPRTEHE